MQPASFERFAGLCAVLAGVAGFLYSVAFIGISRVAPAAGLLLSALFLLLGGLLTAPALMAVCDRLAEKEPAVARRALLPGLAGAFGAIIHGGYDLANAVNPPATIPTNLANLPNPIDPRGLLTFGLAGLAVGVIAWLMGRDERFPRGLARLGYLLAALLIVLYLGRLIVLDATSPVIVAPALLAGFVVNPVWYLWLGLTLWRGQRA